MSSFRALRALVVAAAAVAYGASTVPSVLGGDSGEFATLFATGGIAHPPGFPTMVLWLRALHFLPCKSAAQGAALASALAATLTVWLLQRACLAWGTSGGVAALVSALFAFGESAWLAGSTAEAFALSGAFASLLLVLSAPEPPLRGVALTTALGLTAGLALGDHQTIALLAPVGLLAVHRATRAAPRPRVALASGLAALLVGLLVPYAYAYLLCRTADPRVVPMWIEAPTLRGLWFHALRGAYGTFSLAPLASAVAYHPLSSIARLARALVTDLFGLPLLLLVVPFVPASRARLLVSRGALFALVLAFVLAGPLFAALVNLPEDGLGPTVAARFDLLPEVLVALLVALALEALPVAWVPAAPWPLVAALAMGLGLGRALLSLRAVQRAHRPDVAHFEANVLATLPQRAIVVSNGDAQWGAFLYARYVEHARDDVAFIAPGLLRQAWYRARIADATGASFDTPEGKPIGPKTMLRRLLATGRPLFYTEWPDAGLAPTPHDSYGPLMRVWRESDARPDDATLLAANTALYARYALDLPAPADAAEWGHALYTEYGRAWGELGQRFAAKGDFASASLCFAQVAELAPWSLTPTTSRAP